MNLVNQGSLLVRLVNHPVGDTSTLVHIICWSFRYSAFTTESQVIQTWWNWTWWAHNNVVATTHKHNGSNFIIYVFLTHSLSSLPGRALSEGDYGGLLGSGCRGSSDSAVCRRAYGRAAADLGKKQTRQPHHQSHEHSAAEREVWPHLTHSHSHSWPACLLHT